MGGAAMTVAWTIVAVALAVGACFIGWCWGYDAGAKDTTAKWLKLWPKLCKASHDMATAYGHQTTDDAVRAIVAGMEVPKH